MKHIYGVGVIGGGGAIGLEHLASFQQSPYAKVLALAETSEARGQEACRRFGVPDCHKDYRALLRRKDLQVVSIALPNCLHAKVAVEALEAGKHVMLEKPMATCTRDAARIVAAAKRARRVLMVGQNMRFTPDAQRLKVLIEKGRLGEIYHARAWWYRRSGIPRIGSWFTRKKFAGGGVCYDLGVHLLDLALHLMGNFEIASVFGSVSSHLGTQGIGDGNWGKSEIDPKKTFDVEDRAVALVKFKNRATLYLEVTWATFQENDSGYGIELFGDQAAGSWAPAKVHTMTATRATTEQLKDENFPYPSDRLVHFMECVALGKKPLVKPEESFQVQRILDAIYTSSRTGREVRW
ncbi:MAG: Gfo/Idh/MocA family oxidoreductase [Verrucomicrobiae bacterium]|nr:Gfo/Idh/MocA family oxidoreductase [Verrucomicrobiae bacterium]